MTDIELDKRVERAVENFMAGYGCCQSVVAAFADLYGLDDTLAKKVAAGFGGGVGRLRMMCGAVSGIVMLVGLDCGQTEGSDREGKSACYKVVQELLAKSKEQNGSLICAEILGLKGYEKAANSYARRNITRPVPVPPKSRVPPVSLPTTSNRKKIADLTNLTDLTHFVTTFSRVPCMRSTREDSVK